MNQYRTNRATQVWVHRGRTDGLEHINRKYVSIINRSIDVYFFLGSLKDESIIPSEALVLPFFGVLGRINRHKTCNAQKHEIQHVASRFNQSFYCLFFSVLRTQQCGSYGNASVWCSGGAYVESRPGHQLS
jgi:hypothetical protein